MSNIEEVGEMPAQCGGELDCGNCDGGQKRSTSTTLSVLVLSEQVAPRGEHNVAPRRETAGRLVE